MGQTTRTARLSEFDGPPTSRTKYHSAFKTLYAYAKPHRITFLLVVLCTILAIAADLLQPYLVKIAIDGNLLTGKQDFRSLAVIGLVYLGLSVLGFVFTYLQNNLLQYAGLSIVARIRKELFGHITKLSMSYFDRVPSGSLITNVSSDTETLNQFFSQVLLSLIRDSLTLVLIIVMMFQLDPVMTMYCLILLPIIGLIAVSFRSYMRKTYHISRAQLSRLVAFAAENLSGMNLIRAFHQEKEQQKRFSDQNNLYYRANLREIRTNVLFNRTFEILGNMSVAFVTWLGGTAVFHKGMEFGVLYAFITYIRQFFQPINHITQQWNTLQASTVSVNRIWSIFSTAPAVQDPPGAISFDSSQVRGRIDFSGIEFAYPGGKPVIQGLNLHIEPGEMVGIAGTTGAGKSSLISLLCRFYDVQEGSVCIDGTDIRDIPQAELHRLVGLVQQDPFLYSGTLIDNVRLFDETISEEAAMEACKLVGADAWINRLADGYKTRLSERGSGLSAGERQLISFARIIVFQPKILILDEATAHLDSQSEQLIQQALKVVSQGRTTIVIAHRLSTILQADRIIVMRHGQIVEEGTHRQLMQRHGYYEQLVLHSQGRSMEGVC